MDKKTFLVKIIPLGLVTIGTVLLAFSLTIGSPFDGTDIMIKFAGVEPSYASQNFIMFWTGLIMFVIGMLLEGIYIYKEI